jgi:molecular chaperone GrpE (heat shock protein)
MALLARGLLKGRALGSCSYALLGQTSRRTFSAPAPEAQPAGDEDVVIEAFKDQQKAYRTVFEGHKNIQIPLTDDASAVKKYAEEVESLKRKAGVPPMTEVLDAHLDYHLACSGYNVRQFLTAALEDRDTEEYGDVVNELLQAIDQIEGQTGAVLDGDNEEGFQMLAQRAGEIEQKHGLAEYEKIQQEGILDTYKQKLQSLRQAASDEMEMAKKREGLEFVNVDVTSLKPKLA